MAACSFTCRFDTLQGNIVEWQFPEECDLAGIEYSVLPSGGHRVGSDVILCMRNGLCGLALFQNEDDAGEGNRGASITSCGVLAATWVNISRFLPAIRESMRLLTAQKSSGEALEILRSCVNSVDGNPWVDRSLAFRSLFPDSSLRLFLNKYGSNVFVMWKHAILRRKVLFHDGPPVRFLCSDVHWCHFISSIPESEHPYGYLKYYVTLFDMDELAYTDSWIACTTEQIFESKRDVFSLLVHRLDLIYGSSSSRSDTSPSDNMITLNNRDRDRYVELMRSPEDVAETFFPRLNNKIYTFLKDLADSQLEFIPSSHLKLLGMHPRDDIPFIVEFCRVYDIPLSFRLSKSKLSVGSGVSCV
eukprot:Partr_v1_DN28451_c2_g1_i4_m42156 putative kiaa1147